MLRKIAKQLRVEMTKEDLERQKKHLASDNFEATLSYSKAIDFEDLGRQYAKQGKSNEARSMYQKAIDLVKRALAKSPKFKDAQETGLDGPVNVIATSGQRLFVSGSFVYTF